MGENKVTRRQIRGLEREIALHHEKIALELKQDSPNYGVIIRIPIESFTKTMKSERSE